MKGPIRSCSLVPPPLRKVALFSRRAGLYDDAMDDGRHDFDFLFGRWSVRNRRLRDPLSGSESWYEFEATSTERPMLGGLANLEQYDAPGAPRPIHAIAVRLFNTQTRTWSIYWSTAGSGAFTVPTVGRFDNGAGTFLGHEVIEGREIVVRFTWARDGESKARWEQAFSGDGGGTWETNWEMECTRLPS
jgi:hypothetical protein